MKKLLSIVLAVAMMATMAFAVSAASGSMMPPSAGDWEYTDASATGDGTVTVTAEGDGYKFVADKGWPSAYYNMDAEGFRCNEADDLYLNYDFEVVTGAANLIVYFAGQSPKDQASPGSFICLNGLIDESYINPLTGDAVVDIPAGKYSGSVSINDLGYRADLKDDQGNMLFSGCKVFAVGGEVVVNTLEIGPKAGDNSGNDNSGNDDNDNNNSGSDTKATTTTKKQSSSKDDNPKTGVESDAIALAVVVLAAAGVVTLSVVSKKAKSR
ncbi:MAG: hypothetical protein IJD01_03490 [Clostridia bacterium]|nr:hypothetical protein [Clostridia bacterium]